MPAIAGEGFVLVDVAVFVVALVLIAMLWLLVQSRAPAGRIPIAGSLVVSAIDGLRAVIVTLFGQLGAFMDWQQTQVNHLWTGFINQVVAPITSGLHALVLSAQLGLTHLASVVVPQLAHDLAQLQAVTVQLIQPAVRLLQLELAVEQHLIQSVVVPDLRALQLAEAQAAGELLRAEAQIGDLTARIGQAEVALAAVVSVLPIIHQLQGLATNTGAGVSALERDVAQQQANVRAVEAELAKVLGLAGVAALGAVAIANLIRIARDPCGVCPGLDLSNVQGRLTALEMFGEV